MRHRRITAAFSMIAKLGFILIVAVFGALMFAAGMFAPQSLRQPVQTMTQQAKAWFAATGKSSDSAAVPAAGSTASSASASAQADKTDPIPAESLLIPAPLPDKGQYGLQVGQFASAGQAGELSSRIKSMKLPLALLDVVDQAGKRWTVVALGPYASPDEARMARASALRDLGLNESLPLILLPPPKAKG